MKFLLNLIILNYFSFSIYSNNQIYPSGYKRSDYLSTFYNQKNFNFSSRFAKTDNLSYLDNLNFTFSFKNKNLSIFDLNVYPLIPFRTNIYLRGIRLYDEKLNFTIGKRRDLERLPSFRKNEYTFFSEYKIYKSFYSLNFSFLSEKDLEKKPFFIFSNYFKYKRKNFEFEKNAGFSIFKSFFGNAFEGRANYLTNNKGFNFTYRFKTKKYNVFYNSENYYFGIFSSFFSKITPNLNFITRNSYYNSGNFNFSNENEIKTIFSGFPSLSFILGFENNKNFLFKRGFEISYAKKIFYSSFLHKKGKYERNLFRFELRKYPFLSQIYVYGEKYYSISLDIFFKKVLSFKTSYTKNKKIDSYTFCSRINYSIFNFSSSLNLNRLNHKNYLNLSISLSSTFKFEEMGFGKIYGFIFMDENGNLEYDPGERPVHNIKVIIDGEKEFFTDKYGKFITPFLKPGRHKIEIKYGALPAELGSGIGERVEFEIPIFGFKNLQIPIVLLGEIEGYVFIDKNKNGKKDEDEQGLKNAVVMVNGNFSITDEDGRFYLTALPPGRYKIQVKSVPFENVILSSPLEIELNPGEILSHIYLPVYQKERKVIYKKF